jgi:hypothetical protein
MINIVDYLIEIPDFYENLYQSIDSTDRKKIQYVRYEEPDVEKLREISDPTLG